VADVCIVGAGSSGITTAKALQERGVGFDVFETGSALGGMWRYENDNGLSSAYRSLHIDTSRRNLGYSDFPIPDTYPDFLSHAQVLAHLESYAVRFGIGPQVRYRTRVERIAPAAGAQGGWDVSLAGGQTRRYRAVIVANGHLWDPRWPDFPGTFAGQTLHSHHYRTAAPFEDRRVLIVGIGNSAVDIAVDVCRNARSTLLSTRRGAWIMPKYILGIPSDRWSAFLGRRLRLPTRAVRALMQRLMFVAVGDQARYGMPRPAHPIWREHATLSQELLPYIGHGWIRVKPDVQRLDGDHVAFADGSREPVDTIIYATGYRTRFPFLDASLFAEEDAASLYRRIAAPRLPGLYFAGLVQPIGPTIPLVEIQGRWLAALLSGAMALPDAATMQREIARHAALRARRYVGSPRYALEVDFRDHARQLRGDIARGRAGV
jgi:hypothetical protein